MAGIDKTYVNNWSDFSAIRDWALSVGTVTDDFGNKIKPINYFYYPDLTEDEFYDAQAKRHAEVIKRYNEHPEEYSYYTETYGDKFDEFLNNPENWFDVIIWNTPTYFDIWLIRNCPLEVIQNRLKQQYGHGWSKEAFTDHEYDECSYDSILNKTSVYDKYVRNGLGKDVKFTYLSDKKWANQDDKTHWWIDVMSDGDGDYWSYDEAINYWYPDSEQHAAVGNWISSTCSKYSGKMTPRKIYRILKNWNLPAGVLVRFSGDNMINGGRYCTEDFTIKTK